MELTVFQSDKGDCLLMTTGDGKRMLIDGGMRASYRRHVAPALGKIAGADGVLDLVYVSHIDSDHISGVLQLMDDEVAWRVRDFQHEGGNTRFPDPPVARPPQVKGLWHNAFHEQIPLNTGEIEDALAATSALLEPNSATREEGALQRNLATSVGEGIELSRRVAPKQLGIPLNAEFKGKLAMARRGAAPIALGSVQLTVIGPFKRELDDLRAEWNDWLDTHKAQLARLDAEMQSDVERLGTGQIEEFRTALGLRAQRLGDINKVTAPNLASLMLLAEENGKTVLLTGDGHSDHIVAGLEQSGHLNTGKLHVNLLKVQHHGSEHNIDEEFCKKITADRYLFCGNGQHENPDLAVIKLIVASRMRAGDSGRFKLLFNSRDTVSTNDRGKAHMTEVEALVNSLAAKSNGRMSASFLEKSSFKLKL
jgi:hypothetical protein